MSLKYGPSSEPLHISVEQLFPNLNHIGLWIDDLEVNPSPQTLNSEPCTPRPRPYTLNPEP